MFERGGKKIHILAHHYLEICSQACQQSSLPALLQHFAHGRCTTRTRPRFSPPFSADTDGGSPLLPLASLIPRPAAVPGGSGRRLVSTARIDRTPESKPSSENFAWEIATLRKGGRKRLPHPPRCGETSPESARPAARPRTGGGRGALPGSAPPTAPLPPPGSPPHPCALTPRVGGAPRPLPLAPRAIVSAAAKARPPSPRAPRGPQLPPFPPGRADAAAGPAGPARCAVPGGGRDGSPRRGGESCQKRRKRGCGSGAALPPTPRPPRRPAPPAAAAPGAPRRGSLIDQNVGKSSSTNLMASPLQPPSLTS